MTKRKRALVDVDGVLGDFMSPALRVVEQVSGRRYTTEDLTSWNIFDTVPKDYEKVCHDIWSERGFCSAIEPYPGAIEAMDALEELMDVYIVTAFMASSPTWVYERSEWLSRHFGIKKDHQIFTAAKYTVAGDIFIDDTPHHVERWAAENQAGMPILWNQPYNLVPLSISRPWMRAKKWDDVFGHLERLGL